jgi:hypothetical protein
MDSGVENNGKSGIGEALAAMAAHPRASRMTGRNACASPLVDAVKV